MNETIKDSGQVKIRLPNDMKQVLQVKAEFNTRTLNSEIVNRLAATLRAEQKKEAPSETKT